MGFAALPSNEDNSNYNRGANRIPKYPASSLSTPHNDYSSCNVLGAATWIASELILSYFRNYRRWRKIFSVERKIFHRKLWLRTYTRNTFLFLFFSLFFFFLVFGVVVVVIGFVNDIRLIHLSHNTLISWNGEPKTQNINCSPPTSAHAARRTHALCRRTFYSVFGSNCFLVCV